jgi:hypothetical protein
MSTESMFEKLGTLYRSLSTKHDGDFDADAAPAQALTDDEIARVEELTGCPMPPLARAFYQSEVARRSHAGVPPFRDFYRTGEDLIARCKELQEAKEEYDWEHPPVIPLTAEEDFLVCAEDGSVFRFDGTEGSTDSDGDVENLEQLVPYLISEATRALEEE